MLTGSQISSQENEFLQHVGFVVHSKTNLEANFECSKSAWPGFEVKNLKPCTSAY